MVSNAHAARMEAKVSGESCLEIEDAQAYPGPLRESISRMSDRELNLMSRDDLLHMIRLSRVMFRDQNRSAIEWASENELRTMAHAVRACCRNHLHAFHYRRGGVFAWE